MGEHMCSSRLGFIPSIHMAARKRPELWFQGTQCPLSTSAGTHVVHRHTCRQDTYTHKTKITRPLKIKKTRVTVVHTLTPAGGSESSRPACSTERVQDSQATQRNPVMNNQERAGRDQGKAYSVLG